MSTIRETVQENLRGAGLSSYVSQADPVIRALEAREWEVADRLVAAGTNLGASREQVMSAIRSSGLDFRPAPANVPNGGGGDVQSALDEIQDTLNILRRQVEAQVRR